MGAAPDGYKDWNEWADAEFANDSRRAGLAARAATEAQSVGAGIDAAMRAARSAAGAPPPSWVPDDGSLNFALPPQVSQPPADPLSVPIAEPDPNISFPIPTTLPNTQASSPAVTTTESSTTAAHLGSRVLSRLREDRPVAVAIAVLVLLIAGGGVGLAQRLSASPASAPEQASRPRYVVPSPPVPVPSPVPPWTPPPRPPTNGQPAQAYSACPAGLASFADSTGCYTPGPNLALPAPISGVTMTYYDISGSTADDLKTQMSALGIACSPDEIQAGAVGNCPAAERSVDVSFPYAASQSSGGTCTISSASIAGHEEVRVPRWTPRSGSPPELYGSWKRWLTGVYAHEAGHARISTSAYDGIRRSLIGATCSQYPIIISDGYSALVSAQLHYHQTTNFGANQGPPFP